MLVRQIGTVSQDAIQTDEQILLAESGGGGGRTFTAGETGPATLNPQTPTGAADAAVTPTAVPNVSHIAPGASAIVNHPLLWAGLGAGAAYLLSRGGGDTMSGAKKKNFLVPVLIAGGAAVAWYFLKKPAAASNTEKDWLLNTFHATNDSNQQAMLLAIPKMTDTDIHLLYLAAQAVANGTGLSASDTTAINAMMSKYGLAGL